LITIRGASVSVGASSIDGYIQLVVVIARENSPHLQVTNPSANKPEDQLAKKRALDFTTSLPPHPVLCILHRAPEGAAQKSEQADILTQVSTMANEEDGIASLSKDPLAPKRFKTAYMFFSCEAHKRIRKDPKYEKVSP
jgi:hypothetical protein